MEWITEDFLRLLERDTVLLSIPLVLSWIPRELHKKIIPKRMYGVNTYGVESYGNDRWQ